MTEIAQLFESALRQNQAKAAMSTVARMPPQTTLRELLESDAGAAVRALSLRDLAQALREAGFRSQGSMRATPTSRGTRATTRKRVVAGTEAAAGSASNAASNEVWPESREERIYRRILEAMATEPLTIGQLAKRLEIDVTELRGYLNWMKKMGKVVSSGRARATRYRVA
ncbi:ArsR family transcriptional regulator [Paraliomyxa miuraensis]|uniref:ArsR family transcriptional regulator n=1 Tax=Paraliomyxa miuraensis TaxID=376150 RepID=UPI0022516074|nr:ArsR family transcriptional regulator [Paraliomyxa miuraensis]MCX4239351.1 transcriptional regulator [Paraliomyxa miuraensis]